MRVQGCDAVQVAVLLSEVQAVTNNELGLDVPADVLDLNVSLDDLGLRSRVQISTEAAPREIRFCCSHARVRPESMISSTIRTLRPTRSVSRSLRIRTTPEDLVPEPYEETAIQSMV